MVCTLKIHYYSTMYRIFFLKKNIVIIVLNLCLQFLETTDLIDCNWQKICLHIFVGPSIDQFSFKNVISLCPPCLGGFQKHDKR